MDIIKLKGFENIYAVDSFFDEFDALFGKSKSIRNKYLEKLRLNLRILDKEKTKALQYPQFEKLTDCPFCSIRHVSKVNTRVIFAYINSDGEVVLLSSCKETKTKDYKAAIQKATYRMTELEESK